MRFTKILLLLFWLPTFAYASHGDCAAIKVCFTPGESCEQGIISAISQAKNRVYVQAYSFTANYIAQALIAAQQRGVEVQVILDRSWLTQPKKNRAIMALYQNDIPIWIDNEPAIAHNKIMIIDQQQVITGSYNFTIAAAKHNAENVLFITSSKVAKQYVVNWNQRLQVSKSLPAYKKIAEFEKFRKEMIKQRH